MRLAGLKVLRLEHFNLPEMVEERNIESEQTYPEPARDLVGDSQVGEDVTER
jgi:hypothetical protein